MNVSDHIGFVMKISKAHVFHICGLQEVDIFVWNNHRGLRDCFTCFVRVMSIEITGSSLEMRLDVSSHIYGSLHHPAKPSAVLHLKLKIVKGGTSCVCKEM